MICSASSSAPVGTHAATGTYQTKRNIERDQPTKSYLLAGDERSVGRISDLLASDAVRGGERAACERLRQFEVVRLPTVDEVLRARPDVAEEELLMWEAVVHPAIDSTTSGASAG